MIARIPIYRRRVKLLIILVLFLVVEKTLIEDNIAPEYELVNLFLVMSAIATVNFILFEHYFQLLHPVFWVNGYFEIKHGEIVVKTKGKKVKFSYDRSRVGIEQKENNVTIFKSLLYFPINLSEIEIRDEVKKMNLKFIPSSSNLGAVKKLTRKMHEEG